jgi:hypothetical protein
VRLLLFCFLICFNAIGQVEFSRDVIGSSGSTFSNSNIQFDFTLGEVFSKTLISISEENIQTIGFQQPNKDDEIIISVPENINDDFALYPNPTSKIILFKTQNLNNFPFTICDQQLRSVLEGHVINGKAEVDVSKLKSGAYYFIYVDQNAQSNSISFLINKTE